MLFHYHFWTPHLEEMEKFYEAQGFHVYQRLGRFEGEFQSFNPPLTWDDFREKNVLFRIIELKKDNINVTFGYGKRVIFDHIGFITTDAEKEVICKNASQLGWNVELGDRRTFITTPYKFLIELQTHLDAVDGDGREPSIEKMTIATKIKGLEKDLSLLFGREVPIQTSLEDHVTLKEVIFKEFKQSLVDPNGVLLRGE